MRSAFVVLFGLAISIQASAKPKHPVVVEVVKLLTITWPSWNNNIGVVAGKIPLMKAYVRSGTIENPTGAIGELIVLNPDVNGTALPPGVYQGWAEYEPLSVNRKIEIEVVSAKNKRRAVIYNLRDGDGWRPEWDNSDVSPIVH